MNVCFQNTYQMRDYWSILLAGHHGLYTSMEQVAHQIDTNGGWANLVYAVDESGAAIIQQKPFVPIPMYICRMCG